MSKALLSLKLYRLVLPRYSASAFSGEGAFLIGGRWNSPGVRVVYTTSSVALAVLEALAYRKAKKPLAPRHLFELTLAEGQLTRLGPEQLAEDWAAYPHADGTQRLGDAWVAAGETVGLSVPSVLAPPEVNVLLNPQHPEFAVLRMGGPTLYPINPQLATDAAP